MVQNGERNVLRGKTKGGGAGVGAELASAARAARDAASCRRREVRRQATLRAMAVEDRRARDKLFREIAANERSYERFWRDFFRSRRAPPRPRSAPTDTFAKTKSPSEQPAPSRAATPRAIARYRAPVIDRWGQRGIFLKATYLSARTATIGANRRMINYITAPDHVAFDGETAMIASNIGENRAEMAAAFDVIEEVARASRKNAKLVTTFIVNLPDDLTRAQQLAYVRDYAEAAFGAHDLPWVGAVHTPSPDGDQRNFHAHIAVSMRPMVRVADHQWSVCSELRGELDNKLQFRAWRLLAADMMTEASRAAGSDRSYTGLSYVERGLALKPTEKLGPRSTREVRNGQYDATNARNARTIAANEALLERDRLAAKERRLKQKLAAARAVLARMPLPLRPVPQPSPDSLAQRLVVATVRQINSTTHERLRVATMRAVDRPTAERAPCSVATPASVVISRAQTAAAVVRRRVDTARLSGQPLRVRRSPRVADRKFASNVAARNRYPISQPASAKVVSKHAPIARSKVAGPIGAMRAVVWARIATPAGRGPMHFAKALLSPGKPAKLDLRTKVPVSRVQTTATVGSRRAPYGASPQQRLLMKTPYKIVEPTEAQRVASELCLISRQPARAVIPPAPAAKSRSAGTVTATKPVVWATLSKLPDRPDHPAAGLSDLLPTAKLARLTAVSPRPDALTHPIPAKLPAARVTCPTPAPRPRPLTLRSLPVRQHVLTPAKVYLARSLDERYATAPHRFERIPLARTASSHRIVAKNLAMVTANTAARAVLLPAVRSAPSRANLSAPAALVIGKRLSAIRRFQVAKPCAASTPISSVERAPRAPVKRVALTIVKAVQPWSYQLPITRSARSVEADPRRQKLKDILWLRLQLKYNEQFRSDLVHRRKLILYLGRGISIDGKYFDTEIPGLSAEQVDELQNLGSHAAGDVLRVCRFARNYPKEITKYNGRLLVGPSATEKVRTLVEAWKNCPEFVEAVESAFGGELATATRAPAAPGQRLDELRPRQPTPPDVSKPENVSPTPEPAPPDAKGQPRSSEPPRIDPAQLELMRRQQEAQFGR